MSKKYKNEFDGVFDGFSLVRRLDFVGIYLTAQQQRNLRDAVDELMRLERDEGYRQGVHEATLEYDTDYEWE